MNSRSLLSWANSTLFLCALGSTPATGQTWSINIAGSSLSLAGNSLADDSIGPFVATLLTENTYQPNFVVPAGTFDFGNDLNVISQDGTVISSAGSNFVTVDESGSTFQVRFQSATQLDARDDFAGNANSFTDATVRAELGGLTPGVLYRVRYDWSFNAAADTDHEGLAEDPESAMATLSFDFGGTAVTPFVVAVDEDAGQATDSGSGSGLFFLLGAPGGTTVDLSVTLDGEARARFATPGNGPQNQDLAGSFAFGQIDFTVTQVIPEPASWALGFVALGGLVRRGRRRFHIT